MNGNEILDIIIKSGLFSVLLGLVISLVKFAKNYVDAKTEETLTRVKNKNVKDSLAIAEDCISTVVMELSQTVVDDLKAKAEDGKLTEEEIKSVREAAVAKVESLLTESVYKTISEVFDNTEDWIIEKIEAEVNKNKLQKF